MSDRDSFADAGDADDVDDDLGSEVDILEEEEEEGEMETAEEEQ